MKSINRRNFLQFLGRAGVTGVAVSTFPVLMNGCKTIPKTTAAIPNVLSSPTVALPFKKAVAPSFADELIVAEGFNYEILLKWGDAISDKDTFGFNNDYTAFIPLDKDNPNDGLLWVNHEYTSRRFVGGYRKGDERTKEQVDKERYSVGGSIVRIRKNEAGKWEVVLNDPHNRRVSGETKIPFAWHEKIAGSDHAIGTLGNCSGGVTPWGSILTAEENYEAYYGENSYDKNGKATYEEGGYGWAKYYPQAPEHYGWIVEVNILTGEAKKLVGLGRCCHECATVFEASDGRLVVYTGDDAADRCLYKFISDKPGSIETGTLYVADTENGKWIAMDYEQQPILQKHFKSQTEVLIRLREAAQLMGGTPLDRPEDIDIDPLTGNVLVTLTNNKNKDNYFGSILKIEEDSADKTGMTFKASTFLAGGEETGFACPDNMAFDTKGNLWFTSDISGSSIGKKPYTSFKNNGLFYVPMEGGEAGKVFQVASAPVDAELTGPFFSPDGSTLFLSVQHPGEKSESLDNLTSHWPNGGNALPRSSVVAIYL